MNQSKYFEHVKLENERNIRIKIDINLKRIKIEKFNLIYISKSIPIKSLMIHRY